MTLNIDEGIDIPRLFEFLKEVDPDIVAFQERPDLAPLQAEFKYGWHKFNYRDLFVASRDPIVSVAVSPRSGRWQSPAICCDIETGAGVVVVHCLHLCSLREGFERVIKEWSKGPPSWSA